MWHEARANEKRIKELMVDHKKRAERRRAYYESRLGDPRQLLRVIGSSCKLYPDAEQYYYHENTDNLMPWPVDPDIRIDRFDGRSLLDYIPGPYTKQEFATKQDKDIQDELNFERYHDLVEMERLQVEEKQRLIEVETEWTKLLDRHKALLAMLNNTGRSKSQSFHTFDYGTNDSNENMDHEQESQLLKEADILQYVDDLTDKDRRILNDMAEKYGIQNYGRLLRMAKKDRDDELRELQAKQGKSKERGGRRSRDASRERRRYRSDRDSPRHDDRYYRSKNMRDESSDSDASVEDNPVQSDVVIEFSSAPSEKQEVDVEKPKRVTGASSTTSNRSTTKSEPPKKLTPMEKLKLKMRQGLEKQIHSEEREKRWREREQQLDEIRSTYKQDSANDQHERESTRLQQDHAHLHHRHPKSHPINDIDPGRGLIRHAKSPPLIDVNAPVLVPEIQKDLGSDLVQEKDIRVPGKDDIPQMTDPTAEGGPVIRGDDRMMLLYSLCFNVPE
ncbi:hypothetical protein RO3G_11357 [Lichtheimia corymbifera JMRC:FSU:9682]|uniref:Suppressor of white apricot N-terminal domain-containing protein n=1 Tax=Lichtheimia corymbifera JMRC:FSU:9682 TaxID=1263082 RepID=A0A068SGU9_9FUNG|nr:hypothetical protein RO3G_11357 [Lichtheimia corymbifera JMRC:FSU:9682]